MKKKAVDIKFIQDLYEWCGGIAAIANYFGIHPKTVERWRLFGIPDDYWPGLHDNWSVLPVECFKINGKIKGYSIRII